MLKKLLICFLIIAVPVCSYSQRGGAKKSKIRTGNNFYKKKKSRPEFIFGIGAANFLGDLGGANQVGTFFVKDLEFPTTRPAAQLGVRYKFKNRFAVKGGFYYCLVKGADNLTEEPFRQNRNLNFRSSIYELSGQLEFFFTKEQQGHRYNIRNVKGRKSYDFQSYLFVGVGAFYFNPKAQYNGSWVALQPLGTEGQGLNGNKKYSRVGVCIPWGIGAKNAINKEWSIGLEVGIRKTFTDYIDDVSGSYFDNNVILEERGATAAYLADPSLYNYPLEYGGNSSTIDQTGTGQVRGDYTHKDTYMFIQITASYKIPKKRRTRSKF